MQQGLIFKKEYSSLLNILLEFFSLLTVFFSDNIWLLAAVLNVRPKAEINALEKQLFNYNTSLFSEVLGNSSCHVINAVTISFVFSFLFSPLDLEWNWCSWIQETLMQSLLFSDLLYIKKMLKARKRFAKAKMRLWHPYCSQPVSKVHHRQIFQQGMHRSSLWIKIRCWSTLVL